MLLKFFPFQAYRTSVTTSKNLDRTAANHVAASFRWFIGHNDDKPLGGFSEIRAGKGSLQVAALRKPSADGLGQRSKDT